MVETGDGGCLAIKFDNIARGDDRFPRVWLAGSPRGGALILELQDRFAPRNPETRASLMRRL
jgi:hypothetical protein